MPSDEHVQRDADGSCFLVAVIRALLAAGGDRTRKDANGHTPLAIAVLARKAKMVELLGAR